MKSMTVLAIFALTSAVSDGLAAKKPNFPNYLEYSKVRRSLRHQGWQPAAMHHSGWKPDYLNAFPEIATCYGVGASPCFSYWKKGSQVVQITTLGEADDPAFDSVRICKRIPDSPDTKPTAICR